MKCCVYVVVGLLKLWKSAQEIGLALVHILDSIHLVLYLTKLSKHH